MADSDTTAPQLGEGADQKLKRARDILCGIPGRIDPARIKMKETQTGIKGGQGVVIVGTLSLPEASKDMLPEMKVAVKKLGWKRDDVEESAMFFKSFVNELSLMVSLDHPNIITLVGFVEDMQKGDAWMILPWEGNGNVREFLRSGEWEIPERLSLIQDTAKGLEYLHSRRPPICHGDLKSLNILVNPDYHAVITDFGSARIRRHLAPEKTENASAGAPIREDAATTPISPKVEYDASTMALTLTGPKWTLRWTAPEVFNGVQDLPSDMWALGWVCWEIVTGKIPFEDVKLDCTVVEYMTLRLFKNSGLARNHPHHMKSHPRVSLVTKSPRMNHLGKRARILEAGLCVVSANSRGWAQRAQILEVGRPPARNSTSPAGISRVRFNESRISRAGST